MQQYLYDGPVMEFDRCIAHRYKKQSNRIAGTRISLPGKLVEVQLGGS